MFYACDGASFVSVHMSIYSCTGLGFLINQLYTQTLAK